MTGPEASRGPHPGLVIEWSQRSDGWWALVAYVIEAAGAVVQQWLPAKLLTPTQQYQR